MVKSEMIWRSAIPQVMAKITRDIDSIHTGTFNLVRKSIIEGDPISNAPGQPEDLRDKFQPVDEGARKTSLGVADRSAASVESGISQFNGHPITLHSPIGGSHSIKLTRMAEDAIVRKVVTDVVGG